MRHTRYRHIPSLALILVGTCLLASCGGPAGPTSVRSVPQAAPANVAVAPPADGAPSAAGERYDRVDENDFVAVAQTPLSTFSVDVDTAAYSNVRRFLQQGQLPPAEAVRTEEMLNYFSYDYPQPTGDLPFSVTTETASCPWNAEHRLLRVALKGREVANEDQPPANLVFLIDTSGSMGTPDKLPLLVDSMNVLVDQLTVRDKVSIVTYAGTSGVALHTTSGNDKAAIHAALTGLSARGSTNGGAGIVDAYRIAEQAFIPGGSNRVVLATDGDFNVGVTSRDDLVRLIEAKRESGVFLTVLGFGSGNLNDAAMEALADKGNGNYAYIDSIDEGRKVLGRELSANLHTIAKDVKIQIEFNPARIAEYRLVGYEDRALAARDFNDDTKDAGEIGAGHAVTALYELVPPRSAARETGVDPLRYQRTPPSGAASSREIAMVKLRYKEPAGSKSKELSTPIVDAGAGFGAASQEFRFSTAVAEFAMLLRSSHYRGATSYDDVLAVASGARGSDLDGQRGEFLDLVARAKSLAGGRSDR